MRLIDSWLFKISLVFTLYASMIVFYGLHGVDDAWTLSFDYFYWFEGYEFDRVFGHGNGVLAYFGKTHAFIHGVWAELFGWGRLTHRILSTLLVFIGVYSWSRILSQLGFDTRAIASFMLICLLFDSLVSSGTKIRPEALVFCLGSISVLLALKGHWLWSIVLAFLALETHPSAIIYGLYLLAVWFTINPWKTLQAYRQHALSVIVATTVGLGYYLLLHAHHLTNLSNFIAPAIGEQWQDRFYLLKHFVFAKYYRHLPELVIFATAYGILIWFREPHLKEWRFIVLSSVAIAISNLILQHANALYAVHAYPIFVLVLIWAWQKLQRPLIQLCLLIMLLTLPQYAYLSFKNWGFYFPQYSHLIHDKTPITEHTPIYVGHSAHWFAFNDDIHRAKQFYSIQNAQAPVENSHFVWIRDSLWESINGIPSGFLKQLLETCPSQGLDSFDYAHHTIRLQLIDCRPMTPSTANQSD